MLSDLSSIIWAEVPVFCLSYLAESSLRGMQPNAASFDVGTDWLLGQLSNSSAAAGKSKPTFPQYASSLL